MVTHLPQVAAYGDRHVVVSKASDGSVTTSGLVTLDEVGRERELSPAYRMVFNLYVMEGYKHQEIAELLGITPAASRSNLTRTLEKLRTLLADKEFGKNKLLKKEF